MKYIKYFENIENIKVEVLTADQFEKLYLKIYPNQIDLNHLIKYFYWDDLTSIFSSPKHSESIRLITAYNDKDILGICLIAWWEMSKHYSISYLSTNTNYLKMGISKKLLDKTFQYFSETYPNDELNFSGYSIEGWKYLHKNVVELAKKYHIKLKERAIHYITDWNDEKRQLYDKSREEINKLYGYEYYPY
jgi:hypothetical protein